MPDPKRSKSAMCGHVKRKFCNGERLNGKSLAFAVAMLEEMKESFSDPAMLRTISAKLIAGQDLSDHESSMFVDIFLDLYKLYP